MNQIHDGISLHDSECLTVTKDILYFSLRAKGKSLTKRPSTTQSKARIETPTHAIYWPTTGEKRSEANSEIKQSKRVMQIPVSTVQTLEA
jgi:hypothetical protein